MGQIMTCLVRGQVADNYFASKIFAEELRAEWSHRETYGVVPEESELRTAAQNQIESMRQEINRYIERYGAYRNAYSCEWSNEKLFSLIDDMQLYDKRTGILLHYQNGVDDNGGQYLRNYHNKGAWVSVLAHAIPTRRALEQVSAFLRGKSVLSVGSGLGCWEHMLNNNGCKIRCIDFSPYPFTFARVEQFDCCDRSTEELRERFAAYDTLFLGWSEPDRGCACCDPCAECVKEDKIEKYKHYCKRGYDATMLTVLQPQFVVTIYEMVDFECDCNRTVLSSDAFEIIESEYRFLGGSRLPGYDDGQGQYYLPGVKWWQRNKKAIDPA